MDPQLEQPVVEPHNQACFHRTQLFTFAGSQLGEGRVLGSLAAVGGIQQAVEGTVCLGVEVVELRLGRVGWERAGTLAAAVGVLCGGGGCAALPAAEVQHRPQSGPADKHTHGTFTGEAMWASSMCFVGGACVGACADSLSFTADNAEAPDSPGVQHTTLT